MRSSWVLAVLVLLTVSVSPAYGSTKDLGSHRRTLLQDVDASVQAVGGSVTAIPSNDPADGTVSIAAAATTAAVSAASAHAPDAPDASVGEALPPVVASAADIAAAAATGGGRSRPANRCPKPLRVPGSGLGAAAAVVPAQTSTVTLYQHCNYAGIAVVAGAGTYNSLPSAYNDFVSSVRVPLGLSVTLRENTNLGGRGLTITGPADITCLVNFNFNDITSSMRIASSSTPSPPPPPSGNGGTGTGGFDTQLLNLVNTARSQNGLRTLSINTLLNTAAQVHSQDQASRQTMSHTGGDGSTIGTRITRTGYRWIRAGENVAAGFTSAQSVFDAWMGSAGHRANILGDFVHMGAAVATGGNGMMYWTQVFATPAP